MRDRWLRQMSRFHRTPRCLTWAVLSLRVVPLSRQQPAESRIRRFPSASPPGSRVAALSIGHTIQAHPHAVRAAVDVGGGDLVSSARAASTAHTVPVSVT